MKKILLPFLLLLFVACKNGKKTEHSGRNEVTAGKERSIIGKWVVSDITFDDITEDNMSKEDKKELIGKSTMEFSADGKLLIKTSGENNNTSYSLNEKKDSLMIKSVEENEKDGTNTFFVKWGTDTINLSDEEGSMTLKRIK